MSYQNLINAIARAEIAGQTFKYVASSQDDSTIVEGREFFTLSYRITERLNALIPSLKGEDGISVIDVNNDVRDIVITYSDGTTDRFADIYPEDAVSVLNYTVNSNGELVQEKSDGTTVIVGNMTPDEARGIVNAEVLSTGDIRFTFNDGIVEEIGNISVLGDPPISDTQIVDNNLYIGFSDGRSKNVGMVEGEQGITAPDFLSVNQVRTGTDTVYLDFMMADGSDFRVGPARIIRRTSTPEDTLKSSYDDDTGELILFPPGTPSINLGSMHGIDGTDADDGITIESASINDEGTEVHVTLTGGSSQLIPGTPKQVIIPAGETVILSYEITTSNELVFEIGIPDGSPVRVNVGKVRGRNGTTIDDINILPNGDIEMSVENNGRVRSTIIGNIAYEFVETAEILPTRQLVFTTNKGNKIIATGSPDGENGDMGTIISEITYDSSNEMMATVTLTDGTIIPDIGKVRPIQTHSVARVTDEIIFNFSNGSQQNLGNIDGVDAKNVSGVTYDGTSLNITFDDSTSITATGSINNIQGISYINGNLVSDYSEYTETLALPPKYDGKHGVWLTELKEMPNGTVRTIYSDGSKNILSGGTIHANWVDDMIFSDNTGDEYALDITATLYNDEDTAEPTEVGTISNFYAVDGDVITDMYYTEDGGIKVEWNTQTLDIFDGVIPVWVEDIYLDGDNFMAQYNHLEEPVIIATVEGFNGTDGRWVKSWRISSLTRNLIVTWNDDTDSTIGLIDGVQGEWITSLERNVEGVLITADRNGNDVERGDFTHLDGMEGRWITDAVINANRELEVLFSNETEYTVIDKVDGEDGKILTDIKINANRYIELTYIDSLVEEINSTTVDGEHGDVPINMYRNANGEFEVEYFDGTITPYAVIDGADFTNEIVDIREQDGTVIVEITDGTTYQSPVIVRRFVDAAVDVNEILTFSTNYLPDDIVVGRNAGADVPDGVYATNIEVVNQELFLDLSDGIRVSAGAFNRVDLDTAEMVNGIDNELENLRITTTDNTVYDLGRIKGIGESISIVDGIINIEGKLVLTFSNDTTTTTVERVQGEHGLDIVSSEINTDGNLIFNMSDTTTVDAGFVLQDLGFAPYDFIRTYNRGETCTNDGQIYVALENGVTSVPTPDNSQWARVRLEGDSFFPEASRPEIISPKDNEQHQFTQPYLLAGDLRNYYSVDTRGDRIFQIDLAENDFSNPLYEATENLDGHQANIDLTIGVDYKWRCRDIVKETGYITDWSLEGTFTVVANIVERPTVTLGTGMVVNAMPAMPVFDSSVFNGTGTHLESTWQIKRNDTDEIVYDYRGNDLVNTMIPFGILVEDTDYSVRIQHNGSDGDSPYSEWVPFTTEVKFTIDFTPVISYIGNDINATSAKPYFKSNSFLDEFYYDYMQGNDLVAEWEVKDSLGNVVWTTSNQVDILQVQVGEVMQSAETYTIRVRYSSERFFGVSDWSNVLSFTPDWSIRTPTITTPYDVTEYPVDGLFQSDDFLGVNEEHFGSIWEIRKVSDDSVQHSSYNSFTDLYEWTVSFGEADSLQEYYIVAKHLGRYGESDWSTPLLFTMQEIIEVSVYVTSVDQSVRKVTNEGRLGWINTEHADVTNAVSVDQNRNAYSVSNDDTLKKIDEFGRTVWTYTYTTNITAVSVYDQDNIVIGTEDGTVIKLDGNANELWRYEEHTAKINHVAIGTDLFVYTASSDFTVHKIDPMGIQVWIFNGHTNVVNGVDVDINGNVYSASSDDTVRKISSRGMQEWSFTGHTNDVNSVCVNINFNVFTASSDSTVKMIDMSGTEVWTYNFGSAATSVDCDYLNRAYVGGFDDSVRMISDSGNEVWAYNGNTGDITDVTVNEIPVLMKPIDLTGRYWNLVPPLDLQAF